MQGVNVSSSDCDWICQTTSEGSLARIVFGSYVGANAITYNLLALGLLQPTAVSVTGPTIILPFEKN